MKGNETTSDGGTLKFYIQMFETFAISDGDVTLIQKDIHSDMAVKLFIYLLLHRERSCTVAELIEALWSDDKSVNPAGALKNTAYRLRNILKRTWPDVEFVQTSRGAYAWNSDVEVSIDIEDMSRYYEEAKNTEDIREKIILLSHAQECYSGRLLSDYGEEHWIIPRTAYFQSLYIKVTRTLARLLEREERFHEMEQVCIRALEQESLDEELHVLLMYAYIAQKKLTEAQKHYQSTEKLLYDSLGIGPSEELRELHLQLMEQGHDQAIDISDVHSELRPADEDCSGAFFCEFGVFKRLYELEVRQARRMKMTVYLVLLTLYVDEKERQQDQYLKLMEKGMGWMQDIIASSLRANDIYTRYSVNQYLIMLQACPYENAKLVMQRVFSNYEKAHRHSVVKMEYSMKEVEWFWKQELSCQTMRRTPSILRLNIDELNAADGRFSGTIAGTAVEKRYPFGSISEFMIVMEQILDQISNPQADRRQRTFEDRKMVQTSGYCMMPKLYFTPEEISQLHGQEATYDIHVISRKHNTWQGVVYDESGNQIHQFESALELLQKVVTTS